jgi:hypothetical protein
LKIFDFIFFQQLNIALLLFRERSGQILLPLWSMFASIVEGSVFILAKR